MQQRALYTVIGILVTLLGWLGGVQINKLTDIEKGLVEIRLEITKMQMSIMDEDKVKDLINTELLKHGIK